MFCCVCGCRSIKDSSERSWKKIGHLQDLFFMTVLNSTWVVEALERSEPRCLSGCCFSFSQSSQTDCEKRNCVVFAVASFFAQFCKNFGTFFAEEREIFRNDNVVMIINIWKEWKRRSFKWEIFLQERRRRRRRELRRQWHRRSSREQQIRSKSCCVRKILVEQKKTFLPNK